MLRAISKIKVMHRTMLPVLICSLVWPFPVPAQTTGTGSGLGIQIPDALRQQLQQGLGGDLGVPSNQIQAPALQPNLPMAYRLPASALEQSYSQRAGTDLRLFGYEAFGRPSQISVRQAGALQDSYIVGVGDQVIVDVRGQENQTYRAYVNREGNIILPRLQPIPAAGRRFGDFRRDVEQRVGQAFVGTNAFVSIGTVRQLTIFVAGEVNAPGTITVSALNSPIDALLLAGGVKKGGSLRNIVIERGGQRIRVDLYSVLAGLNVPIEANLADGDKVVVPPIGRTVAITGEVGRPGIYELSPGSGAINANQLVALAGGYLVGGAKRLSVLRVRPDGTEALEPAGSEAGTSVRASEILYVLASQNVARGRIVLEGQVRIPGNYTLARAPTLRALLPSMDVLEEDPFVLFGVISRKDPASLSRTLIPFAPIQIIRGETDVPLQEDDVVHVFSRNEIRDLVAQISYERSRSDLGGQDLRELHSVRPQQPSAQPSAPAAGQPATDQLSQGTVGAALAGQTSSSPQTQQYTAPNIAGAPVQGMPGGGQGANQAQLQYMQAQGISPQMVPQTGLGQQTQLGGQQPFAAYPQCPVQADPQALQNPYCPPPAPAPTQPKQLSSRTLLIDLADPAVRNQLSNYRTSVLGAVQLPGDYLVAPGVGLDAVVGALGGLTTTADLTGIEITTTAYDNSAGVAKTSRTSFSARREELGRIRVNPGDVVRVRELFTSQEGGQVIVRGQVRFPGRFDILRGERLSSVLARAGGITDIGYPHGAVFTRRSAARAEEDGYRRAAQELERSFTVIVADQQNLSPQAIQFIRDTVDRLQTAEGVGRISVEADPVKLAARPERDTILEPDDFLFIPRRPNSVSVTGEVLSAGSFLFTSGRGGRYYIDLAGGYGPAADRGRTFVLMPDGTARPLTTSWLSFGGAEIVPGATVIVPRDLRPFRFRNFALDFTQILSQLAVSAASIAVISRNN